MHDRQDTKACDMTVASQSEEPGRSLVAFFGRRNPSRTPELPPKSNLLDEYLELVLIVLFGGMIGVVAYVHFFHAR
jgi:hypothetical protein